jgi:hypothetical protein
MGIDFGDMAPAPVSHPAGHESNPLPRTEMHPAKLAARVGPSLSEHTFHGQGGWVAHVRRRVASANGTEKSARNTTTYYGPKGRYHQYTEQPNGEHKRTASDMPYDRTRLKEFLGAVAERSGRGMSPKEQQHEYRMRELRGRLRKALRSAIVNTSH